MASAGRVLPLPKGAYSSTTTYHLLDFVSYQGSTYICKQTSTGNAPTNTTYWQIMAQGTESASVAGNYYGTCSTGASTSAKIVSIPATENFVLQVGDIIGIKFDNTNTANNPSLNVNNSGAKPIYYNNSAVSTSNLWVSGEANRVTIFMYDGTNWIWMGHDVDIDTDTLSDLKDTTISSASNGQVLMYDSTSSKWKNQTPTTTLVGLSDTQISSATDGQVLKYNATSQKWENADEAGGILPHLIVISETGSTVTVTKGTTVITATETSTGHFECDLPEFGTWTIDAILGGDDAQVSLVVDTVKVYTVDDSHFHADITVKYPSGATCNLAGQGESYYATGSPYTFTVHHAGQYTITVVYDGQTYTDTVTVTTTGQTFSKKVPSPSSVPANDIDWWLWFGGVSGSYSSLSDILADSTALATLMASTDAVDYLVRCKKWINAGLVPVMTSNTTPSGEAISSSDYSASMKAYMAFNNDSSNNWMGSASDNNPWIGYIFEEAKVIRRVGIKFINCSQTSSPFAYVEGSNDGINWAIIHTGNVQYNSLLGEQTLTFTNENAYTRYRVRFSLTLFVSGSYNAYVEKVQFYELAEGITENQNAMSYIGLNNYCANTLLADSDWLDGICNSTYFESVLNVKVPVMTSNTAPSGVAKASSEYSTSFATYKAFDSNNASYWLTADNGSSNAYIQYKFASSVKVHSVIMQNTSASSNYIYYIKAFSVQGSNDGTNFDTLYTGSTLSNAQGQKDIFSIVNSTKYLYYRISISSVWSGTNAEIGELQFYGREDV